MGQNRSRIVCDHCTEKSMLSIAPIESVAVYLTKDAFGFKEGQLLTINDIEGR